MSELVVTHHPKGGWAFFVGVEDETPSPQAITLRVLRDGTWRWYEGDQPAKVKGGQLRLPGWSTLAVVRAEEEIRKLEARNRREQAEKNDEDDERGRRRR